MQTATARALRTRPTSPMAAGWLTETLPHDVHARVSTLMEEAHTRIDAAVSPRVPALEPVGDTARVGGKRVRMLLTSLAGLGAGAPRTAISTHAAVGEMVHAATLVHDDVIDFGLERRGRPAAHVLFGNKRAVLGGDALLTESLRLLSEQGLHAELHDLLITLSGMVEGEYLQLARQYRLPADPEASAQINRMKTSLLFGWCACAGLMHLRAELRTVQRARSFGLLMGEAFQLVDDLLDVVGDPDITGKEPFADLREGKITLPLAWLLSQREELTRDVEAYWRGQLRGEADGAVLRRLREEAVDARLDQRIRGQVDELMGRGLAALDAFGESSARDALSAVASALAERVA